MVNYTVNVIALASLVVAVTGITITYFRNRQVKRITYRYVSFSSLLQQSTGIASKVGFTYEGQSVSDVWLVILEFVNDGTMAIKEADFSGPLKIEFVQPALVLSVDITSCKPAHLKLATTTLTQGIDVAPALLNKTNSFRVEILLAGKTDLNIYGHIADTELRLSDSKPIRIKLDTALCYATSFATLAACISLLYSAVFYRSPTPVKLPVVAAPPPWSSHKWGTDAKALPDLLLSGITEKPAADKYTPPTIEGYITNKTSRRFASAHINFLVFDKQSVQIGNVSANVSDLDPGVKGKFSTFILRSIDVPGRRWKLDNADARFVDP